MDALSLIGLATGVYVNFEKSKLIPLKSQNWHAILWSREILDPHVLIKHLGYPIGWLVTQKQQLKWILDKLNYWKTATWPLHVRLRIVQSIVMAYIQFFLPLLHWID